jgi:hypothetical protein
VRNLRNPAPARKARFRLEEALMSFALRDVGMECFALVFRGADIGSVFSTDDGDPQPWVVALSERQGRITDRPTPFLSANHRFATLSEVRSWLGIKEPSLLAEEAAA